MASNSTATTLSQLAFVPNEILIKIFSSALVAHKPIIPIQEVQQRHPTMTLDQPLSVHRMLVSLPHFSQPASISSSSVPKFSSHATLSQYRRMHKSPRRLSDGAIALATTMPVRSESSASVLSAITTASEIPACPVSCGVCPTTATTTLNLFTKSLRRPLEYRHFSFGKIPGLRGLRSAFNQEARSCLCWSLPYNL